MQSELEIRACNILRCYPIKKAALFGSAASGLMRTDSDIDMLVEFVPGTSGLDFFGLKLDLEDEFQRTVDLITFRSLLKARPEFKQSVEKGARVIYER